MTNEELGRRITGQYLATMSGFSLIPRIVQAGYNMQSRFAVWGLECSMYGMTMVHELQSTVLDILWEDQVVGNIAWKRITESSLLKPTTAVSPDFNINTPMPPLNVPGDLALFSKFDEQFSGVFN